MSIAFLVAIGGFFILAGTGLPIAFAMFSAAIAYLFITGQDVGLIAEQSLNGLFGSFVLLAVPLFILAANFMNAGTVSDRLLAFSVALVGRFRGGLAQVNVVASLIFSGMSGSAIADAAGIGRIIIDMMRKDDRYPAGYAAALTAASSVIGPIIPPSIPMVLYALISNTSVGYLFLGGVIPGLLIGGALMVLNAWTARRRNFATDRSVPLRELPKITFRAFPVLLMPVILLAGIYGGATTPTEAAAVAAAYALLLASLLYRALSLKQLHAIILESALSTAIVGMIIASALVFNYLVASENIPGIVANSLSSLDISPLVFLLGANVVFLLLGALFDATTLLLIVVPLFVPTMHALGVDPVHFGVVIVINIMIGLITPPYGVLLFVINGVTKIPLNEIIGEIWPFLWVLLASLLALVLFPEITLFLPRMFGYR